MSAPDCPTPKWYDQLAAAEYDEVDAACANCDGTVNRRTWEAWRRDALRDPEPARLVHDDEAECYGAATPIATDADRPYQLRLLLDDDATRVEVREWRDGIITVWWCDGPRIGEDPYGSLERALLAVARDILDTHG